MTSHKEYKFQVPAWIQLKIVADNDRQAIDQANDEICRISSWGGEGIKVMFTPVDKPSEVKHINVDDLGNKIEKVWRLAHGL